MRCRICRNKDLKEVLSLGNTPSANNFLQKEQLNQECKTFPLGICFCENCKLVQLTYIVSPEILFKHYLYTSSTSPTFSKHLTEMADSLTKELNLNNNSLAVDIGSNDGYLLKSFQKNGVNTIGVEPSENISKLAMDNGIETICDFFNETVTKKILTLKGKADVVTANNVFAHIDDINEVIRNVKILLKDNGTFIIEVAYLPDMLEQVTFDMIYHEHLSYYSLTPLNYFFEANGMKIVKVKHVYSQGGSIRVYIKKNPYGQIDASVHDIIQKEKDIEIGNINTYKEFSQKVQDAKNKLLTCLKEIKKDGKKIAAYGAPAKSTTLLSFCNIGKDIIDYVVDQNTLKQWRYTPCSNIPIVPPYFLENKTPDYVLILAWNFSNEIIKSVKEKIPSEIKFIIPLPRPVII